MNRNDLISMAGQLRALLLENIKDVQVKFERVKGTEEDRELEFSFLITGEGATPNGGDVFAAALAINDHLRNVYPWSILRARLDSTFEMLGAFGSEGVRVWVTLTLLPPDIGRYAAPLLLNFPAFGPEGSPLKTSGCGKTGTNGRQAGAPSVDSAPAPEEVQE